MSHGWGSLGQNREEPRSQTQECIFLTTRTLCLPLILRHISASLKSSGTYNQGHLRLHEAQWVKSVQNAEHRIRHTGGA